MQSDSIVSSGFDNVEFFVGTTAADYSDASALNSHWARYYTVDTYSVDVIRTDTNFTTSSAGRIFSTGCLYTISAGNQSAIIFAGAGIDTLVMPDTANLTGSFDGQGDFDTLKYSAYSSPRTFYLNPVLGITDDFNVTETSISGGTFNIQKILGGTEWTTCTAGIRWQFMTISTAWILIPT
jgi:hypothetical protein